MQSNRSKGFSLVEILLVLAIIGIISAIAIPSFIGQRKRAQVVGDAISNTKTLSMMLESRKAETGIYGAPGTYIWKADGSDVTGPALIPTFKTVGNSKMDYTVVIAAGALSFSITATDPKLGNATMFQTDQTGAEVKRFDTRKGM